MRGFLVFLLTLGACASDEESEPNPTLFEVCSDVYEVQCARVYDCQGGTATDYSACFDGAMAVCCTGDECAEETDVEWSTLDACTDDLRAMSCQAWADGYVPASCQ